MASAVRKPGLRLQGDAEMASARHAGGGLNQDAEVLLETAAEEDLQTAAECSTARDAGRASPTAAGDRVLMKLNAKNIEK